MMAVLCAEQFVSVWVVCVWERLAKSGCEENINEDLNGEHGDVVVRPEVDSM